MTNLLLVEDHPILRAGLRVVIEQITNAVITAEAENGQEAVNMVDRQPFDLIIMDVNMPVLDGVKAAKAIKEKHPQMKILIYSGEENSQVVLTAIKAGADGYLFKSDNTNELKTAIETVMRNENYLSQRISNHLIPVLIEKKTERYQDAGEQEGLSGREREILSLILEGNSNKKIGEKLFLSIRTVSTHRYNLMKKLGCSNIVQLFRYAIEKELV